MNNGERPKQTYNDNAFSYRYLYITITNEAPMITNEN